jgi:hypothetical protein
MAWGEARTTEPRTAEEERWWRLGAEAEARARRLRSRAMQEAVDVLVALDGWEPWTDAERLDAFRAIYFPTRLERLRHAVGRRRRRLRP